MNVLVNGQKSGQIVKLTEKVVRRVGTYGVLNCTVANKDDAQFVSVCNVLLVVPTTQYVRVEVPHLALW